MVLALLAQMLGQVVDALGQQGHLDLGVAGVLYAGSELCGDLSLALCGYCHSGRTG